MITRDFNNGWGNNLVLRQFELEIARHYLDHWHCDAEPAAVINSTWYSQQYHGEVLTWLHEHPVSRLALCSFLDPAIVKPDWFQHIDCEIKCVGYYAGPDEIDAWALFMDRYFDRAAVITGAQSLDTAFLCLNRKPHWHRRRLVKAMSEQNLLDSGVVTLGSHGDEHALCLAHDVAGADIAPNAGTEEYGIANDIMSLGPMAIWNRCLLTIVTETVYDVDQHWFVSEKIYKPVLGLRPFLVYAPNGARGWLSHVGIENFVQDFSDITDLDLGRPECLVPFLVVLSTQPAGYLQHKYVSLWEKIQHNQQQFYLHVALTKLKVYHN